MYPQKEKIILCLRDLFFLLFPDHYCDDVTKTSSPQSVENKVFEALFAQLSFVYPLEQQKNIPNLLRSFLNQLPSLREQLLKDADAAFVKDPAASSVDEVILSYPGFLALMTYRLAHQLFLLGVPLIPRMMTEHAHSLTGCDIHPAAQIGEALFIDHATGVVIGQTAVIGNRVTIFQGVTLGALAIKSKDDHTQRHPTIEDDVTLYSHATVLGGNTVIGKRSIIGGSCWITNSVPADTKVILAKPQMIVESTKQKLDYIPNWDI